MPAGIRQRRSYGTGSLYERADSAGIVSYYGQWRHNGVRVKRAIGLKRTEGSREGLTRTQAETELRRLIAQERPAVPVSEALTVAELGRRYLLELERRGGKRSTRGAIETALPPRKGRPCP
jgi:hypothetical protein